MAASQLSVGDIIGLLKDMKQIYIGWDGNMWPISDKNQLEMDAYKDYLVNGIYVVGEGAIELSILCVPQKKKEI